MQFVGILISIWDSISVSILIVAEYFFALLFQKIVFLEYHEPEKEKKITRLMLIGFVVTVVINIVSTDILKIDNSYYTAVFVMTFFLIMLVYNAFTGRKRAKFLALIEFIPMIGYYGAIESLLEILFHKIDNYSIRVSANVGMYVGIMFIIVVLEKKKPKFVQDLENDLKGRVLSLGEEFLVWGMGIGLYFSNEVLSEMNEVITETHSYAYVWISVLNFLVATLVIIFVINSNYRNYHNKKNIELKESLAKAYDELERRNLSTLMALTRAIEAKDRYTKGHSSRVAKYSKMLAAKMGKSEEEQELIYNAALLHDVGKLRVPGKIINKESKLTDEEFEYIKLHPVAGYNVLRDIDGDNLLSIGAKFHHERYDGKGYPNGLSGENIPEIARIIAVADSYDAMASNRSYRKALPQEVIKGELEKGMGTQFDPEIAKVMLEIMDEDKEYDLKEKDKLEKTILIVDDSNINLMIAENMLKKENQYHVLKASSGAEAVKIVAENAVDLVLLDIEMPEMDGFETLEKIREFSRVAVSFMTADKELATINRANELGVKDYITKPFSGPGLLESVYGALYSGKGLE